MPGDSFTPCSDPQASPATARLRPLIASWRASSKNESLVRPTHPFLYRLWANVAFQKMRDGCVSGIVENQAVRIVSSIWYARALTSLPENSIELRIDVPAA